MKKYRLLFDTPWGNKGDLWELDIEYGVGLGRVFRTADGDRAVKQEAFKDWFEEEDVKPERWRPIYGQESFRVYDSGRVGTDIWDGSSLDKARFENGNLFRTEAQAQEAARRVKATLLAYQEELLNEEV